LHFLHLSRKHEQITKYASPRTKSSPPVAGTFCRAMSRSPSPCPNSHWTFGTACH
jgi:hypothetical protein